MATEFSNLTLVRPECKQLQALMTKIRDKECGRVEFVAYSNRILKILLEEALSNSLHYQEKTVVTGTGSEYKGLEWTGNICGVSIMRAGESMEQILRDLCPGIRIGKILIQRNETSSDKAPDAKHNYAKLPKDIDSRTVLLLDPMLATGGSAKKAIDVLVEHNVKEENIVFANLVCCPEGARHLLETHPKVRIFSIALDERLDHEKYIVPGLGDFGDRYFGTV